MRKFNFERFVKYNPKTGLFVVGLMMAFCVWLFFTPAALLVAFTVVSLTFMLIRNFVLLRALILITAAIYGYVNGNLVHGVFSFFMLSVIPFAFAFLVMNTPTKSKSIAR